MTVLTTLYDALCIKKYFYSDWWECRYWALWDLHELCCFHFLLVSSQISLGGWSKLSQILERILLQVSKAHCPFLSPLLTWPIHQSLVSSFSGIPPWKLQSLHSTVLCLGSPCLFLGMDGPFLGNQLLGILLLFLFSPVPETWAAWSQSENSYFLHPLGFLVFYGGRVILIAINPPWVKAKVILIAINPPWVKAKLLKMHL